MTTINLSTKHDDQGTLLLISSTDHSQDSFACLIQAVLAKYNEFEKIEFVVGADRGCLRFSWRQHFFYLQLESCIETMWIEACDLVSEQQLPALSDYMRQCD